MYDGLCSVVKLAGDAGLDSNRGPEMTVAVKISEGLREYCRGANEISVSANTIGSALAQLQQEHPSLYTSVCDETGAVRRHVNLFVNSDLVLVRQAIGMETPLSPGDVLTIWPAVSGG
jgi:molybdopterin converting factor small subunit